jgi:hypothetical protein
MKKTIIAGLSVITLLASSTSASAYRGDPNVKGPNYTPERHEAMERAFETNNYGSWLKLMEGRAFRLKEVVKNKTIFAEFAKAHESGVEALNAFRAKYNLGMGKQDGSGQGRNR